MRKLSLTVLALLLMPFVYAGPWYYNSEYLILNSEISSKSTIVPLDMDYSVEYVLVNMSFFPRESWNQAINSMDITPEPRSINESMEFIWKNPAEKDLEFEIKSVIKNSNQAKAVKTKVDFPLKDISEELAVYTVPSETIDSDNEEIIDLANELAKGEDDEYVVVFKLAEWVKNHVNYDLTTSTEKVSQKASWVLQTREGVCDEITTLFIAMNRVLGIPARFVSGISYTNALDISSQWGPHGWAEVYFPGYGWVPFDVTYGEFGFVDPTHIKMRESIDGNTTSTKYQWYGKDVDLETRPLDIKTKLVESVGEIEPSISLGINAVKENIGFNSYNLMEVSAENLKDYYVSTELYLSKSKEIEVVGQERRQISLKPNEKKNFYWVIKFAGQLSENYLYTFPIAVYSLGNLSAATNFKSKSNDPVFSEEDIKETLNQLQEEETKTYSRSVDLRCDANPEYYLYEKDLKFSCVIKNKRF